MIDSVAEMSLVKQGEKVTVVVDVSCLGGEETDSEGKRKTD